MFHILDKNPHQCKRIIPIQYLKKNRFAYRRMIYVVTVYSVFSVYSETVVAVNNRVLLKN